MLKQALKKIPGLQPTVHFLKSVPHTVSATAALLYHRFWRKKAGGPVRVGFLCQYIPAWSKTRPVYEVLKQDPRFETVLLCVPDRIQNHQLVPPEDFSNDTFSYFQQQGYENVVSALGSDGTWLDLESLQLDYVFYHRPYSSFMPKAYLPIRVSRYAKICMIMYGVALTKELGEFGLVPSFFRSMSLYFAENKEVMTLCQKKYRLGHMLGLQKTVFPGVPALKQIADCRNLPSPSWDFSQNDFRVLWTPRWTTDKKLGGSNFFTFKDFMLTYAEENPQVDILMRPHPLMFDNFVNTGELTEAERETYLQQVDQAPNVALDGQKEYGATFWKSSVLVGDFSGILPEYFVTGKPIIFCAKNFELEMNDFMKEIAQCCYVVHSEEELRKTLDQLREGVDPLEQMRKQKIVSLFGDYEHAAQKIAEELIAMR